MSPHEDRALPATHFRMASTAPDEAVEHMRAVYTRFDPGPVDPAGFDFSIDGSRVGPLVLSALRHSAPLVARAEPSVPLTAVIFGDATRARLEAGREEASGPVLLLPRTVYASEVRDPVESLVVALDREALARVGAELGGPEATEPVFHGMTPRSPALARYWTRLVTHVRRDLLDDEALAAPLLRAQVVRQLAVGMLAVFPNSTHVLDPGPGRDTGEPATVRRAVAYIDAHAGEPIGLSDIAGAARIGPRGLQQAFARHRGTSPLAHLRRVRLERARRDLQAADPSLGDTVGAVAARWGHAHPGRFIADYRRRYGETPGTTLRR